MKEISIAVCDTDERYALTLAGSISRELPFEVLSSAFSSVENLHSFLQKESVDLVIITQSAFDPEIMKALPARLVILKETPDFAPEGAYMIDRFQSRAALIKSVINALPEQMESYGRRSVKSWTVIGIYSPVRKSLQTTFALSLGQMLARQHKTLYMNFESFSGFSGWMETEFESDITDLLYYYDCDPGKLGMKLPLMVHHLGDLDVLPPARGGTLSYEIRGEGWVSFMRALEQAADYEYLILDLTDSLGSLMEVMDYCDRIYTCVKNDSLSRAKLEEYEKWMESRSRGETLGKTIKFAFPEFKDLPDRPDMLTRCELAGFVKSIIDEDVISA